MEIPRKCLKTYWVLADQAEAARRRPREYPRGRWMSAWQLQACTGQSSADVRARQLREIKMVDWRKAPGNKHGAIDYAAAAVPGQGREYTEED